MIGGTQRGLDYGAINSMEVGALVDYCIEFNNQTNQEEKEEKSKVATQADWSNIFG